MIRVFLLLFFVVSSCQQKKRGVVCDRVDANSGQCIQQLNKVVADTPPPVTKPTPIIPQLPPIETTDKKEEVTEITDETLLKDIIIKSRCLDGECPEKFTCRIAHGCGTKNLIIFTDTIQNYESTLCEGNTTDKVFHKQKIPQLTCGWLEDDNVSFMTTRNSPAQTPVTSKHLNQRICVIVYYTLDSDNENDIIEHTKKTFLYSESEDENCRDPSSTPAHHDINFTKVIELTFSLVP